MQQPGPNPLGLYDFESQQKTFRDEVLQGLLTVDISL